MNEFPTTRWSLVARASGRSEMTAADETARRAALGTLLTRYLPALRSHLLRKRISPDRLDDLLQSFVADKVIGADLLAAANRERGHFRALLCTALNNFAANQLRHDTTQRRSPKGVEVVGLDQTTYPAGSTEADPFDVDWAREVLAESIRRMREECIAGGRHDLWDVFEIRLLQPALHDVEPVEYDQMVRRFGYASPKHAANAVVTAKRRFEQTIRSVIREYMHDEKDVERELAALGHALHSGAQREPEVAAQTLPTDGV
jgi:DNA-directed RNA polymerase specialized sigma24 family protein